MPVPVSVLIPTKNEEANLRPCLESVSGWADEVVVVDSGSTDGTVPLARKYGATVLQFKYEGGWPKKRQWALDSHEWRTPWVLLLDADEALTPAVRAEIEAAIRDESFDGYRLRLDMIFLGKRLRFGGFHLEKLALFRVGRGRFEKRFDAHTADMTDIEVHEHVRVDGRVGRIRNHVEHRNVHDLTRYIAKHNAYSTWQAELYYSLKHGTGGGSPDAIEPRLFGGSQAQRRRWLKGKLMFLPGSSLMLFLYRYGLRLGVLDGAPGLVYCAMQGIQEFHTKAKLRELELRRGPATTGAGVDAAGPRDR